MNRVGIFAGTFDPIHKGHIAFALATAEQCGLDAVYFLPERQPRGKHGVGDFATRSRLIQEATTGTSRLHLLDLADAQFTVETTLPQLETAFAGAELYLLIGSDIACHSLSHWPQLPQLLAKIQLIIGVRAGHTAQEVDAAMRRLDSARYTVIASPYAHVSSSQIRGKVLGKL